MCRSSYQFPSLKKKKKKKPMACRRKFTEVEC